MLKVIFFGYLIVYLFSKFFLSFYGMVEFVLGDGDRELVGFGFILMIRSLLKKRKKESKDSFFVFVLNIFYYNKVMVISFYLKIKDFKFFSGR